MHEWWNRKNANYIQNYARWNMLTLAHVREKFFTKSHEKLIESIPYEINKFLENIHDQVEISWRIIVDAQIMQGRLNELV